MDKKKLIKIFIVSLIIIIAIITIILVVLRNKDSSQIPVSSEQVDETDDTEVNTNLEEVSEINEYFMVKDIVNQYNAQRRKLNTKPEDINRYMQNMTQGELKIYQEENAKKAQESAQEAIYNMLNLDYINEFNITKDNIREKFISQNQFENFIQNAYVVKNSSNAWTYFVSGTSIDTTNSQREEFNLAISLDMSKDTFCIYPSEYLEKHNYDNLNIGSKVPINIESIENNGSNIFKYKNIEDVEICKEYFNNYKCKMLHDVDKAYEMLDKEYREEKFGTLQGYKDYVSENYEILSKCNISKYQVEEDNGIKSYMCIDDYGNYYIFNATSIMQYTLALDTYTIDIPKFTKKYNTANEQEKVALNINKIMTAISAKDYKYVYNKLADSFKNNYFENEDKLKEYLENNILGKNIVSYEEFSRVSNNIYTYEIKIADETESNYNEKSMNIVMELRQGTDFVMSFSIE